MLVGESSHRIWYLPSVLDVCTQGSFFDAKRNFGTLVEAVSFREAASGVVLDIPLPLFVFIVLFEKGQHDTSLLLKHLNLSS